MGKTEWRRLIKKGAIFIVLFLIMDLALGSLTMALFRFPKSGKYAHITHIMEEATHDCFVFGDSHAVRHYVPDILADAFGYTVYNAGVRGQHLVFHLAMQEVMLARHQPKMVILDLSANWLYPSERNNDRLADLHPYYWDHRTQLKPILDEVDTGLDLKLAIRTFQQNSIIIHILKYLAVPQQSVNGYMPLDGEMDPNNQFKPEELEYLQSSLFDASRLEAFYVRSFQQFIDNCESRDIVLIAVISPTLNNQPLETNSLEKMRELLKQRNVPLLDYSRDPDFKRVYHLFNDFNHLNHKGASLFSDKLVEGIKSERDKAINASH